MNSMAYRTILTIIVGVFSLQANGQLQKFDDYYTPLWGLNHLSLDPQGTQVQLTMDQSSGAGFRSKLDYGSGMFHVKMKLTDKLTGGVLTCFYLTSAPNWQPMRNHFEIDFEFLSTNGTVQTNVYDHDGGHREQSFNLWFDPKKDFHSYGFLWNSRQIVFTVDNIPIRVFKNNMAHGVAYPIGPMHIEASIWNPDWAGVIDWSQAPFNVQYQDFGFHACPYVKGNRGCSSTRFFWNRAPFLELNPQQRRTMNRYRKLYMSYDYCSKRSTRKRECFL